MSVAKDLWEIFATNPRTEVDRILRGVRPSALSPEEKKELDADLAHRDRLKQIYGGEEAKAEAARHDW